MPMEMASLKAKVGLNNESNSKESARTSASSPILIAGAASLSLNNRTYTLDDLDTIATVGKLATTPHKQSISLQRQV